MPWKLYKDINSEKTVEIRRNADGTYDLNLYDVDPDTYEVDMHDYDPVRNGLMIDWCLDVGKDCGPQTFEDMMNEAEAIFDVRLEEDPIDSGGGL